MMKPMPRCIERPLPVPTDTLALVLSCPRRRQSSPCQLTKWVSGKNSFSMERTEADKEDTKNAMQLIREPLNQADHITA